MLKLVMRDTSEFHFGVLLGELKWPRWSKLVLCKM
jgi:hypothetical protein